MPMKKAVKLSGLAIAAVVALFAAAALALPPLSSATNFTVACDTTAGGIIIGSTLDGYASIYCQNISATSVHLGGANITTANAPCISTSSASCSKSDFAWDVSRGAAPRCLSASGTVTLKCIAGK